MTTISMRSRLLVPLLGLTTLVSAPGDAATSRSNQTIATVQIDSTRPCLFFYLVGVSEADPAVPNMIWFAIPASSANYNTYASMLLTAKFTGRMIAVQTDGSISCSYATASVLSIN